MDQRTYASILFGFFILQASAHNWIHGASRAFQASQIDPAPPRQGPRQPHRAVGAHQDFVVEWSTGHENMAFVYFVALKASDESKLKVHSEDLLDDYIDSAPPSAHIWADQKYDRTHVSCTHHSSSGGNFPGCDQNGRNSGSDYDGELNENDPEWNDRTPFEPYPDINMAQFRYKTGDLAQDKKVAYENLDYPWIEAVWKFQIIHGWSFEWDAAKLSIPGRQGPGEYMLHYVWSGYRDVIDIDLLPADAVDKYGSVPPGAEDNWVKTNHCAYPNLKNHRNNPCYYYSPGDSIQDMLNECGSKFSSDGQRRECEVVNCVPLHTPSLVRVQGDRFDDAHAPWGGSGCRKENVPQWALDDETAILCYGIVPRQPEDPTFNPDTENFWYIREMDPEDPIFYSTCYRMENKREFSGNPMCDACESSPPQPSRWQIGDKCLTCGDIRSNTEEDEADFKALRWQVTDQCARCF